jgi:hypothetical protein
MRNGDNPGQPLYYDSVFETLAQHVNACGFLMQHYDCDGCERLSQCRGQWDCVCDRFEDKAIPPNQVQPLITRISVF